jgi:hypothetical protein
MTSSHKLNQLEHFANGTLSYVQHNYKRKMPNFSPKKDFCDCTGDVILGSENGDFGKKSEKYGKFLTNKSRKPTVIAR